MINNINKQKITFIIPCYRSEQSIKIVTDGIIAVISKQYDYKIILVNDNSPDNVFHVIRQMCALDENIIGIKLSRNFGQQAARMAAIPYIDGDYVVFMDDDGQHPSDGIPKLIDKLKEGYDIAYAKFDHKKESLFKQFGSYINTKMTNILIGKPKHIKQSSFFAMRAFVASELIYYRSPFPYLFGYFMQVTRNIANVDIEHQARINGKSGYNLRKLVALWFNGYTSFSVVPLRIASWIGAVTAMAGFGWGVYIVIRKILTPEVAVGYTSIMASILFIGGMIMLMLGMLGEYIGRMFITINNIPQYIVNEKINCTNKND